MQHTLDINNMVPGMVHTLINIMGIDLENNSISKISARFSSCELHANGICKVFEPGGRPDVRKRQFQYYN